MNLGFSHQVNIPDTEDCTIVWQDPNHFTVTGIDKQKVCLLYTSRSRALLPTLSWLLRTSLVSWRTV